MILYFYLYFTCICWQSPIKINSALLHVVANKHLAKPTDQWNYMCLFTIRRLHWRHDEHDGVSNHQPHDCLLNRLFRRRSKKTSKLRVTGLCAGNSSVTGEFLAQKASDVKNVSIWWRHHETQRKFRLSYDTLCNVYRTRMRPLNGLIYGFSKTYMSRCAWSNFEKRFQLFTATFHSFKCCTKSTLPFLLVETAAKDVTIQYWYDCKHIETLPLTPIVYRRHFMCIFLKENVVILNEI